MIQRLSTHAKNRIKSSSGESIAETLVALLISSLALVMLAGAIATATRIVTRNREKLDQYYAANEYIAHLTGDIGSADTDYAEKKTSVKITISKEKSTDNSTNTDPTQTDPAQTDPTNTDTTETNLTGDVFESQVTVYENKVFDKYHVQAYAYEKP